VHPIGSGFESEHMKKTVTVLLLAILIGSCVQLVKSALVDPFWFGMTIKNLAVAEYETQVVVTASDVPGRVSEHPQRLGDFHWNYGSRLYEAYAPRLAFSSLLAAVNAVAALVLLWLHLRTAGRPDRARAAGLD
jgi:hypothetical protein